MNNKQDRLVKIAIISSGIALMLASSIASAQEGDYVGFKDPVKGVEFGLEHQLETIEGDRAVERIFARVQRTYEWEVYKDERGSTVDVEAKGGIIFGRYKGAYPGDAYGTLVETSGGLRAETQGTYTFNTDKIDPFIGLSAEVEGIRAPRIEWQADVLAGIKFNVADDKDLSLAYSKTLVHGFDYYKRDIKFRQDEGHAIALIGTKRNANKTSHSLKLKYERFDKSDMTEHGYEPDTDNWLLSYKKTY